MVLFTTSTDYLHVHHRHEWRHVPVDPANPHHFMPSELNKNNTFQDSFRVFSYIYNYTWIPVVSDLLAFRLVVFKFRNSTNRTVRYVYADVVL